MNKWWINEKSIVRDVVRKIDGDATDDKYDRRGGCDISQFPTDVVQNYRDAKNRLKIGLLPVEKAGIAVRTIMRTLGKQPNINYTSTQQGRMAYRNVIWGVNPEDGVEVSNELVAVGITDFKITPASWLTLHIPRECQVRIFYNCDDPEVWKRKYNLRFNRQLASGWVNENER